VTPYVFQLKGLRVERAVKLRVNPFHHAIDIPNYLIIPKPQNTITFFLQPARAGFIAQFVCILAVLRAIELDKHLSRQTRKVDNVWTNRNLAAEM
jgi:hypothetical protein